MSSEGHPAEFSEAGEVFDLGYRSYEGEREGRWRARRAIWRDGIRVTLGIGRSLGQKVAPFLLLAVAMLPALILIVLSGFVSSLGGDTSEIEIPTFAEYYEFAIVPLMLFAAIVSPELLCPDRRQGVLTLYLIRPIRPGDYAAARWFGFLTVALGAVWVPEIVLFIWEALQASSTGDWLADNWTLVPRFLAAGTAIAVFFTTLSMFIASFSTRRAYAAVLTLVVIFVGAAIAGIAEENFSGTLADVLSLAGFPQSIGAVVQWAFGEPVEPPLAGGVYAAWIAALTVAMLAGLLWRYERRVR